METRPEIRLDQVQTEASATDCKLDIESLLASGFSLGQIRDHLDWLENHRPSNR
jgi:hypothetical protein